MKDTLYSMAFATVATTFSYVLGIQVGWVDPLRYGGDHRESSDEFWTSLLTEFDCPFQVIGAGTQEYRLAVAMSLVTSLLRRKIDPVCDFMREVA